MAAFRHQSMSVLVSRRDSSPPALERAATPDVKRRVIEKPHPPPSRRSNLSRSGSALSLPEAAKAAREAKRTKERERLNGQKSPGRESSPLAGEGSPKVRQRKTRKGDRTSKKKEKIAKGTL